MKKTMNIFLIFLIIALLILAGCTGSEPKNTTPSETPTPQIVYVTVFVTPTSEIPTQPAETVTGITIPSVNPDTKLDEEFLEYVSSNQILEAMSALSLANPGSYSISTGYNAVSKEEAERLTALLSKTKPPGSEKMKAYRSAMMNALAEMDGSTAGFTRYRDAMQTVILTKNAAYAELHSAGSATVDAIHLRGHGNSIQSFNATETGQKTFVMHHSGDRNFAITLNDGTGKYISLLVNEIGDYDGKKSQKLNSGNYTLDITADGDWTIGITSA